MQFLTVQGGTVVGHVFVVPQSVQPVMGEYTQPVPALQVSLVHTKPSLQVMGV
jgi:hypothetical protein